MGREPETLEKIFASLLEIVLSCGKIQLDLGLYNDGRVALGIADTLEQGRESAD
ncbi:MAG: hypothetical protein ACI3VN_11095 [Candidatus Onthomonas sp.]